ncbi:hypothetical protein PMAYCL1PPCAC_18992, partial [Pristionchus mayeri]
AEELRRYQELFQQDKKKSQRPTTSGEIATRGERNEADRHYIGVRSRRSVDKKLTSGQFFLYHEKPSEAEIPINIELKIAHMTSTKKIFHFPILQFKSEDESYYAVTQTENDVKMFPSIASLVQYYLIFSHVDPGTEFKSESASKDD